RRGAQDPRRSGVPAEVHGAADVRVDGELTRGVQPIHQGRDRQLGQDHPRAEARDRVSPPFAIAHFSLERTPSAVMAGLVPAIHVLLAAQKTWMPGTRPGMTVARLRPNN